MTTTTTDRSRSAAAAQALVAALPLTAPLRVERRQGRPAEAELAGGLTASYIGSVSADVAVALDDMDSLAAAAGAESSMVSAADVLRPALEAATAVLGAGVLGEVQPADGLDLFDDTSTEFFALTDSGSTVGWFAVRLRGNTSSDGWSRGAVTPARLARINDVEMALTVEIGRTRMAVRDVLDLEPGGVIELDRSAGAPADILLNGRRIAHGEVVVVDQDYAVRITQILDADQDV